MRLSEKQIVELQRSHGVLVREACDSCGKILGAVRWTRRSEPGEWCSEICRDGSGAVESRNLRRAGRPRKYKSERQRRIAKRVQGAARQRAFRRRSGVTRNCLKLTEHAALTDASFRSGCPPSQTAAAPLLEALR